MNFFINREPEIAVINQYIPRFARFCACLTVMFDRFTKLLKFSKPIKHCRRQCTKPGEARCNMSFKHILNFILLITLNYNIVGQEKPECCKLLLEEGLKTNDYNKSINILEEAKNCPDSRDRCPQLDSLIKIKESAIKLDSLIKIKKSAIKYNIPNYTDDSQEMIPNTNGSIIIPPLTNSADGNEGRYGIEESQDIDSLILHGDSCKGCKYLEDAQGKMDKLLYAAKPDMVFLQGGEFIMGNTFDPDPAEEVRPHKVKVHSFYLSKNEITFWEYYFFCIYSGSDKPKLEDGYNKNYPIINVSWYDAVKFCNWRSKIDKLNEYYIIDGDKVRIIPGSDGYRLPTEAEWEYAARGMDNFRFSNGRHDINLRNSNFNDPDDNSTDKPLPVGSFKINNSSINDLSGNVSEWCWDWYSSKYLVSEFPKGPEKGSEKSVRGGGYNNYKERCTVFYRQYYKPEIKRPFIGFRIAKNADL
jgi:formylglycine-generating enzyme required for sulfatase activity